jgi:hypothetical protein
MTKYFELNEENQEIFDTIWEENGMFNYIDLKLLGVPKAKELIKVQKTNAQAEYLGKCPDSIICTVYEQAFDRLDEKGKKMLAEDALAQVSYDFEKDKINVGVPQIVITVGGRAKYGEELLNYAETGVLAIQQIAEEEAEKKAAARQAKKAKKNG